MEYVYIVGMVLAIVGCTFGFAALLYNASNQSGAGWTRRNRTNHRKVV